MRPAPRPQRAALRFHAPLLFALLSAGCAGTAPADPAPPEPTRADFAPAAEPDGYDVVIEGGRVVDGTGNPWFHADVGIRDGRIETIAPPGLLASFPAATRLDAQGMVVAPGFIDIQSHSRASFLGNGDGRVISKVTMGVTTEIMGEATTNAPVAQDRLAASAGEAGSTLFATFDEWLRAMEAHGASVNFGSFVGASTLRVLGMGYAMGDARGAQIKAMQGAVRQAMEEGAFGVASALIYAPGNFASTDELVALAGASAPYGGVYATHMRSEADRLLEGIDEAIEIGTRAGVPVEIYHLKAAGRDNWPKAAQAIAKIDSARAAGVDIQANMYPYTAGFTELSVCFPPWASADGALFRNLASPERRAAIRRDIENNDGSWENLCQLATPEGTMLLEFGRPEHQRYAGRYLSEISPYRGTDWIDAAMDLVLAERRDIGTIFFMMSDENVAMQLRVPWMKFGTDAGGEDPGRRGGLVHPRAYGTFTRILGRHVREEGVLDLEEAVRKMTSAVATRLGIRDRGLLAEGYFADVVVFDPDTVADVATYEKPHAVSQGIRDVLVNGVPVLRDGRHTGALPGRAVRGPGWIGHYP